MLHTPAQYTPRQLLESGRRAEAEGNLDLAGQYYWHVSETHPHTAEGAEAYACLSRMGFNSPQPSPPQPMAPSWNGNGFPAGPSAGGSYGPAGFTMPAVVARAEPRPHAAAPRARKLPPVRQGYGLGYVLASMLGVCGWLLVVFSAVLPIAAGVGVVPVPFGFAAAVAAAVVMAGAGVVTVLLGQMAHALFDQANATRELVSIERAKWSAEH